MKKIGIIAMILVIAIIFLLTSCTASSGENIIFGTFYNLKIKGNSSNSTIKNIEKMLIEIENEVSTSIESSDIYKINHALIGTPISVGEHTIFLFKASLQMYQTTNKAFNAAIFPLVELWNFSPDTFIYTANSIPNVTDIATCLDYSKMENFQLDEQKRTITRLNEYSKLDFGGIAKGYAVDKAIELAQKQKDAIINIGGNISVLGKSKRIGITHPRQSSQLFGIITLDNKAIATSGDYERFYIFNETRYSHIIGLDGYPANINNEITSVTVVGESAMLCDVLSTSIMILGELWAENIVNMGYSAIIIAKDNYTTIGDIDFEENQATYERK